MMRVLNYFRTNRRSPTRALPSPEREVISIEDVECASLLDTTLIAQTRILENELAQSLRTLARKSAALKLTLSNETLVRVNGGSNRAKTKG